MNPESGKIIIPFVVLIVIGIAIIVGVQSNSNNSQMSTEQINESTVTEEFWIGTVGSNAEKLTKRFLPTADYLSQKLSNENVRFEGNVVITKDVAHMKELLLDQEIDLYFESPLTSYLVSQETQAEIILLRWKEGIPSYNSVFYVQKDSPISSLDDLVGKTIVFQSHESTSGYLLPLYHLTINGYSIDGTSSKNINYVFSGDDENSIIWVLEGKVDVGVSANQDLDELPDDIKSELKIIETTIELPRQFVSHRSEMTPEMVEQVKSILLDMNNDSEGKKILEEFKKTSQYSEIKNKQEQFAILDDIISTLELN